MKTKNCYILQRQKFVLGFLPWSHIAKFKIKKTKVYTKHKKRKKFLNFWAHFLWEY